NVDIDTLPVIRYVDGTSVFKGGEYESEGSLLSIIRDTGDIFEGNNSENRIENVEDNINKGDDSESKPDDSPLKEIYTGQTFTSFALLDQCLKRYSTRMGFETKIVKVENDNNVCIKKIYKCRYGDKYLSKKKLDPTANREQESAYDYEEPQILLDIALEDYHRISVVQNEGELLPTSTFQVLQRIRGQEIDVRNVVELDSKKVSDGHGLGLCKMALNIAITNGSNKTLEDILQQFIDEQISVQNENISEQELNQENDEFSISNTHQHKSKGRPANKRYLMAIEENNSKNSSSSNQAETSELGSKKKNKPREKPKRLNDAHTQVLTFLRTNVEEEFKLILKKRNIPEKLNELDALIAKAKQREKDGQNSAQPTSM
ncbi:17948_t:CDS:2, partial [Racocetra fulgida]